MRKLMAGLTAGLCTFFLGMNGTFIVRELSQLSFPNLRGVSTSPLSPCQTHAALDPGVKTPGSTDLSPLTYCELAENSSCYDGKVVRVRARLSWDERGLYLYNENCRQGNASVRFNDSSILEFSRMLRAACGGVCQAPLDIDAVGVFEKAEASAQTEVPGDARPFRFNVKKTERLSN